MFVRKSVALVAIAAVLVAACSNNAGSSSGPGSSSGTGTANCKVGVAWATSQEERYKLRDDSS